MADEDEAKVVIPFQQDLARAEQCLQAAQAGADCHFPDFCKAIGSAPLSGRQKVITVVIESPT